MRSLTLLVLLALPAMAGRETCSIDGYEYVLPPGGCAAARRTEALVRRLSAEALFTPPLRLVIVWSGELNACWAQYQARLAKHLQEGKRDPQLVLYRWMLEEYRVSLFAQQLGTKLPVSDKRVSTQWRVVVG